MRLRPAVLLSAHSPDPRLRPATPLKSIPHFAQFWWHLSPFRINTSGSVDSKQLYLSLESTLMKNRGRGGQLLLTRNCENDLRETSAFSTSLRYPFFPRTFNLQLLTLNLLLVISLRPYILASLPPASTSSFLTSHGIITCRKITGSGHTFTCRPRCPPCGLIHASFGTSPLLRIRYVSEIGTCVSRAPAMISIGAVGFPSSPCETSDIFGKIVAKSSTVFAPS